MITDRSLQMLSPEGFTRIFEQEINQEETYLETYLRLEDEYKAAFGRNRYSSYNSFQTARRERRKKRRLS